MNSTKSLIDQLTGGFLVQAEAITQPLRERLVSEIAARRDQPLFLILDAVKKLLDDFAPSYAGVLVDAEMTTAAAGMADLWGQVPKNVMPEFGPVFVDAPPILPDFMEQAGETRKIIFPKHDEAVQDLLRRNVVTRDTFDQLADDAKQRAFTVAGDHSTATIDKFRQALIEDIDEGTSLRGFRNKLAQVVDTSAYSPSHIENVYRTNVQAAFSRGQSEIHKHPIVSDVFPYAKYTAVRDSRTRPTHAAMMHLGLDGTSYYWADDPLWEMYTPPWHFQCRCNKRFVTRHEAARNGVTSAREWVSTGSRPPMQSRLWYMPPRDPKFVGPGTLAMSLDGHGTDCCGEVRMSQHEWNRQLREIISGGVV